MARSRLWCVLFVLLALSQFRPTSAAPQERRTLRGTVTDTTGGVIISAVVQLDDGAGHQSEATTDERGVYQFAALEPANYTLRIVYPGFSPLQRTVDLRRSAPESLDLTLEILLDEKVDVASTLTLQDSPLTQTLTREELALLPDDSRRLLQRLRELAGTRGRRGDVVIYVDGFREGLRVPPKERIQMIRISAHPFSAEFPEPGRARIEITTRPGADKVKADLALNFSDEALNGREFFSRSRPASRLQHVTGYLSGPLLRNRLSISAFGGQWEQDTSNVFNATVLDPVSQEPLAVSGAVPAPTRISNLLVGADTLAGKRHTFMMMYGHNEERATNQGLDTAYDLPERVYTRTGLEDIARGSLLSIATSSLVNDLHVELGRRSHRRQAVTDAPAVLVLDAFHAGGNQDSLQFYETSDTVEIRNTLTYAFRKHMVKVGVQAEGTQRTNIDRSGFGGTFIFGTDVERDSAGVPLVNADGLTQNITPLERYRRTLLNLPGYGPSQLSIVSGDPRVAFKQGWLAWFAQDDWAIAPRLTVSLGLRHEWQSLLDDPDGSLAARFGAGWTIDAAGRNVVRGGVGLFDTRLDGDLALDTTRFDGHHQHEVTVQRPGVFPEVPVDVAGSAISNTAIHLMAPDLRVPRTLLSTVSYERKLPGNLLAAVEYAHQRGSRLLLRRNHNARTGDGVLPFPGQGPIIQYESLGEAKRDELQVSLRFNVTKIMSASGGYTRAWSRATTDGWRSAPAAFGDLSSEWGLPADDREHQYHLGGTFYLPWQIYVSPYVSGSSGRPFNVTTGRDNNGDTLFTDRPGLASEGQPGAIRTPLGIFNPNPRPGDVLVPRNLGRGPDELRLDFHVSKVTTLVGSAKFTLACDVENVANRANYSGFTTVVTSPLFGQPNRALGPRRVLLSARISY